MNAPFPAEDTKLLAALTRHTRSSPDLFSAGRQFLAQTFTTAAIRARRIRGLEADIKDVPRAMVERVREELDAARRAESDSSDRPQAALIHWLLNGDRGTPTAHLRESMSRAHAEGVILAAVFFWDRSDEPNPSLPKVLNDIPWGTPEGTTGETFMSGRWLWVSLADKVIVMEAVRHALTRFLTETGLDLAVPPSPHYAPTASTPEREHTLPAAPADADPAQGRRRSRKEIETARQLIDAQAATLAHANPEWTKAQIAKELGIPPSLLSDTRRPLPVFTAARRALAAERDDRASKLGGIERRDTLRRRDDDE